MENKIFENQSFQKPDYETNWSDILLGNQFLKLYFFEMGIGSSLIVDRIIKLDDLRMKKTNEIFKFAIVRSKPNEKNIELLDMDNDGKEERKSSYSRSDYNNYNTIFDENKFLFFSKINNFFMLNKHDIEFNHQNKTLKYTLEENRIRNLNTEKIIHLAFSGFFNMYNNIESDQDCAFFSEKPSSITNFFNKMKSFLNADAEKKTLINYFQIQEREKDKNRNLNIYLNLIKEKGEIQKEYDLKNEKDTCYFGHEIICHYAEKLLKQDMSQVHQKAISKIIGENSNPLYSKNDCDGNYSLFFLIDENLWEWREFSGEIFKVGRYVKSEFAKDMIFDYIKTKNIESEVFYENDITIFSERGDEPLENIEASSKNCLLTLMLTIIFLINYFIAFPQNIFYEVNTSMKKYTYSFYNDIKTGKKFKSTTHLNPIITQFIEEFIFKIYNNKTNENSIHNDELDNKNKILYLTDDVKDILFSKNGGVLPNISLENVNNTNYINDVNVFSGFIINFDLFYVENKTSPSGSNYENVPLSSLNYYNYEYDKENLESELFDNFPFLQESSFKKFGDYYEIYGKAFYENHQELNEFLEDCKEIGNEYEINDFAFTSIIYNLDYNALFSFTAQMRLNSHGDFEYYYYFRGMLPFIKSDPGKFVLIIILSFLVIVGLAFLGFGHISIFINSIFDSINTKSNQLAINEIFDLLVIILIFISQIFFMVIFIFSTDVFPLKTNSKQDFIFWLDKLDSVDLYQKITGISIFFIIMRLLKFFMVAFPSFGIVFQTLKFAYKEIISFFLLVCLMLAGIGALAHSSFGYYSDDYTTLSKSYFQVYLMFIGIFNYKSISNAEFSNPIAPAFFIIFMIVFNLILINLFISIILNNYKEVKEKFQTFNNVYTIIVQEKAEEFTTKLWDLLICKHPQKVELEMKNKKLKNRLINFIEKHDASEKNVKNNLETEKINLNVDVVIQDNKEVKNQNDNNDNNNEIIINNNNQKFSKVPFLEKVKYHINRLNLKQILFGEGWNKEEFNSKRNELLQKMEIINLQETIKEYSIDYDNEFFHLIQTIFYILYIVIFITMMNFQLRLSLNSQIIEEFQNTFEHEFREEYNSFAQVQIDSYNFINRFYNINSLEVNTTKFYNSNSNSKLLPKQKNSIVSNNLTQTFYQVDFNISVCEKEFDPNYVFNFLGINYPFFRFTFRLYSVDLNQDNNTKSVFPYKKKTELILNEKVCGTDDGEYKSPIIYLEKISKYILPENYQTAFNCGGYVFLQGIHGLGCNKNDWNAEFMDEFFKKPNLDSFYIEYPLFNVFNDFAVLVTFSFIKNDLGDVKKYEKYSVIPINRFITSDDFIRTILECLFLIISIFFFFLIIEKIFKYFIISFENDFEQDENKDDFKDSNVLNKFLRFNFSKFKNEGILKSICSIIQVILKKSLQASFWLLESIISYLRSDGNNILDFIYLIISITMIFSWYSILEKTNKINFQYSKIYSNTNNNTPPINYDNISILSELKDKYDSYFLFQAINGMLLFLRILEVFKFSHSINNLMKVVYKATPVVLFHVLSMIFFNIGFCFAGYTFYSQTVKEFKSLSSSFLYILVFMTGNIDLNILSGEDPLIYTIFILFITFSNYLLLLNILLSIVVHAYFDVKNEIKINFGNEIDEDFLTKIKEILYQKISLIFKRIEIYQRNVIIFEEEAEEKIKLFNNEIKQMEIENTNTVKNENSENKTNFEINHNKLSFYELFAKLKNEIDDLTNLADYCDHKSAFGQNIQKQGIYEENDKSKSFVFRNYKNEFKQKNIKIMSIFEKVFTYIYLIILDETPDLKKIFVNVKKNNEIKTENIFYKERFKYDNSIKKQEEERSNTLKNLYLEKFMNLFQKEIIKKPGTFFEYSYFKKFKEYIKHRESHHQKLDSNKTEDINFDLYFAERVREPLENFDNMLYCADIFKIRKTSLNKILNIIIYPKEERLNLSKQINVSYLNNIKIKEDIEYNNNFKDVLGETPKLLKYLKYISMTYDLIVKHFYLPKEIPKIEKEKNKRNREYLSQKEKYLEEESKEVFEVQKSKEILKDEKDAYMSFYLKIFLERQFDLMSIQYLNQNIPDIKEKLFENDILKLLRFPIQISGSKYCEEIKIHDFISDENISIRNEIFNYEYDIEAPNAKKKIKELKKNKKPSHQKISKFIDADKATQQSHKNNDRNKFPTIINTVENNNYNSNITDNSDLFESMIIIEDDDLMFDQDKNALFNEKIQDLLTLKKKCLKIYLVWNTLFIVLFQKNFKFLKFLENISYCKFLYEEFEEVGLFNPLETKNDITYRSNYLYLFSRLFFLEKPIIEEQTNYINNNNKEKRQLENNTNLYNKKIDLNLKKLNEVRLLNKLDENDVVTPMMTFYTELNNYLFQNLEVNYENNIKKENPKSLNNYSIPDKFKEFYPGIFATVWNTLKTSIKKILFYGFHESNLDIIFSNDLKSYNQIEYYQSLINKIYENSLKIKESALDYEVEDEKQKNRIYKEIKIIPFFCSEQRSHMFHFLKFPADYFDECKKSILGLPEKLSVDFDKYKNYESLFKFLHESKSKIKLKYIYDVYNIIFEKLFKPIKLKLQEIINENDKLLIKIVKSNKGFFESTKFRVKFVKYFKYILTMKKFEGIKSNTYIFLNLYFF